jgi:hypothetical protein
MAIVLAMVSACGSNKDDGNKAGGDGDEAAKRAEADKRAVAPLAERLAAESPPSLERAPIAPPNAELAADAEGYVKAARVSLGPLAAGVDPDIVFAASERWLAAPEEVRKLGKDARSGEVAGLIAAGAMAPEPSTAGEPSAWKGATGVAIAWAQETAAGGQRADASWKLLAAIQLGYDLARGKRFADAEGGLAIARDAARALRHVIANSDKKSLPNDALAGVLAGCLAVLPNRVSTPDMLMAGARWDDQVVAAAFGGGEPPAGATEADLDSARANAAKLGGAAALVAKRDGVREAIDSIRSDDLHGGARQAQIAEARAQHWGKGAAGVAADDVGRLELANAEMTGTCLVIALELDRRKRNKLAKDLAALTPKPLAEPLLDPIRNQPWELVDDGLGGRVLRSGSVQHGGKTARVEISISAR